MYLAYLDESGDAGLVRSPTRYFVLSCILVHESNWLHTLDSLVTLRRNLQQNYGIPTRPEIKASDFRRSGGPLRDLHLSRPQRMELYRQLLQYQAHGLNIAAFSIAIEKQSAFARGWEPRYTAWTFALQRINRFCENTEWAMIFPDEGHGFFIRRRLRHMRRFHYVPQHWGRGTIAFPLQRIVEDPNDRRSQDSYFIQLADWNAYAAHRSNYVDPIRSVPDDLWDELGNVLLANVNAVRGGPPGMVVYP